MLQLSNQSRRYFQLLFFIFVLSTSLVFTGCSGGGGSSKNNSSTPKIAGAVSKAANLVAASSASGDSVVLEWLPGEGKDLSYDVHLSKVKNFTPDANTKKLTTKADSATINNLESNTTYYAMIVTNSATDSKSSLQLPVTTSDVIAELNTSLTLKDVEPTAVTDNNITTSEDVKSGEIIYATSGEPYLRKAVAVNKDAQGKNVVTTEPVHIRDVYQDLSFSTSVKLVDIDAPVKSAPSIGYVNAATMIPNSNSTYDQQIVRTWDTGLTMTSNRNVKKTALRAKRLAVATASPSPAPSTVKKIEDSEKYYSGNVVASIVATIGKDVNTPINLLRRNQSVTYEFDGSFGESDSERASKKELCEKNGGGTFWYDEDGDDGAFNVGYDSKCQNMPVQMCKVEASADVTHPSSLNDSNLPSVVVNNNQPYISWNPIPENIDYEEGSPYTMDIDVDITPGVFCGTEYEDTYSEETIDLNDITLVAGDTLLSKSVGLTDEEKNVVFDEDGFKLENVFTADYSPTVEFKAKIERATLKEAKAKLNSTLHLGDTIKLNAETSGSHTFPIKPIYTKKFVKVISAGPVPIVIVGRLRLLAIAELESSGKIEATVNLDSTLEMDLGVVYDPDTKTWKPTKHKDFTYEVKAGGKGDVEATVKIRIVPTLELSLYDAAAAQFLVEPYVYSKVGVEGEINVGLGNVSGSYIDITAQFTSLEAGIGMDGKVYVGPAWDSSDDIGLTWPSDAVYAPSKLPLKDASFLNPKQIKYVEKYYEATGTYKQFALISETPVLGIPKLSYNFNLDAIPPKDINTRAIQIEAKCEPINNPLYPVLGKKVYINCAQWKSENITDNFTMIEGDGNNTLGIFWLVPNETNGKYGNDKFRLVNNSSLGWARQYISSEYEYISDADTIPEYWAKRYSPDSPMSNDDDLDNDGYTNLQEYKNGTNPTVPDGKAVTKDTTPPTFISQNSVTVAENQTSAITLKADDQTRVSYSISGGDSTAFDVNATTGEVTFKSAPDYETKNVYTFTATATDAMSNSSTQDITINISDVDESVPNTAPIAIAQSLTMNENTSLDIILSATDADDDPLTYSIVTTPAHGSLTGAEPNLTYIPDTDYIGSDSFTFQANDTTVDSDIATISITVNSAVDVNESMIYVDEFDNPDTLTNNWVQVTGGSGHPAEAKIENGKLVLTTNGGSDGYMGIGDGSVFIPKDVNISGDFVVEVSFKELFRHRTNGYKDNSGFGIILSKSSNKSDGILSLGIAGNYSGYFDGYNYNEYEGHRISSYNGVAKSAVFVDDDYNLSKMYSPVFKIKRKGNVFTVAYQFQGDSEWIEHSVIINDIDTVTPILSVGSGDGGNTRENGSFSAAVDYLKVYKVDEKEEPITLVHHGFEYSTVTSPYTGRVWLDRNLGASQVCTALNDTKCYGDYYQWGRNADGHEKILNTSTTETRANNIENVGHNKFIVNPDWNNDDWVNIDSNGSLRQTQWSLTDGTSVCPKGYRVPTITELKLETLDSGIDTNVKAFDSFLKIPSAGNRYVDSELYYANTGAFIWSSSATDSFPAAQIIRYLDGNGDVNSNVRTAATSIRCIKD